MVFWNRKKKMRQQEELERQAQERLEALRQEKQAQNAMKDREEENPSSVPEKKQLQVEIVKPIDKEDQKRYVKECCEAIGEADTQIERLRGEYEKVTEELTDIQKIDRIGGESQKSLLEAAKTIVKLTRERNQYKNRNLTISDAVIRRFDPYNEQLVDEIKKMYEMETYEKALEGDLDKLHEEKKKLRKEKTEIVEKQNALKSMAKILIFMILSLFVLFVAIYYAIEADMTLPYLGTILLAAISSTVIFLESNRNRRDMALTERKIDKAVSLLNTVKVKCVNNLNLLDYNKSKFGVKNAAEFEQLWNEYCKAKEYERKFRENTEQLNYYCDVLVGILRENAVKDSEIWISRVLAIADNREMVEIRHTLNLQRQSLREQIGYNENMKKEFVGNIDRLMEENPDNKEKLMGIVERYQ